MQTHIEPDDPNALRLRDAFFPGTQIHSVPIRAGMKSGQCFANVLDHVRLHLGAVQQGWLLTVVPGVFVEATHHAVWESPSGDLIDLTDFAFPGMTNAKSTFILDTETPPLRDYWHASLPSHFLVLNNLPVTRRYANVTREIALRNGELGKLARQAGAELRRSPSGDVGLTLTSGASVEMQILHRSIQALRAEKKRYWERIQQISR